MRMKLKIKTTARRYECSALHHFALAAVLFSVMVLPESIAQTTYDWKDNAPDGYWKQGSGGARWWPGDLWDQPPANSILRFNNNHKLQMTNNVAVGYVVHQILFGSLGSGNRTITGNSLVFTNNNGDAKIENNNSGSHSIEVAITADTSSNDLQINPVSGDLTFTATVDNDGNKIEVYGGSGNVLAFEGALNGSGVLDIDPGDDRGTHVKVSGHGNLSGDVNINQGEFWLEEGGAIGSAGTVYVGNGDGGSWASRNAKLWISDPDGGSTLTNDITVNNGNDNTRYIGGLNTSGENTYAGTVTLNGPTVLEANDAGGTITFSGIISNNQKVTLNGPGTVKLTAENTFGSSQTLYIDKGTLELNRASGDPLNCSEIKLGYQANDVALKLNSSAGFTLDNQINVRSTSDTKTIHNTAGTNTLSASVYLDGWLTVTSTAGRVTFSGTELDLKGNKLTVKGGGDTTINSALKNTSGTGALTKEGSGTLTLTGANTFGGATTLSGGTTVYTGTNTSSAVTIASGATLAGSGSVGSTTVNGTIAPGTSIGEIRTSALTLPTGGTYTVEMGDVDGIAGTNWDLITVSGTAASTVAGGNDFTIALDDSGISNFTNTTSYTWKIIDAVTLTDFAVTDFTIDDTGWTSDPGDGVFSLAQSGNDLVLKFVVADPAISHGPATLSYTMIRGKVPASQSFSVTNSGGGTLNYTNTVTYSSGATGWVSVSPATSTRTAGLFEPVTVSITKSNLTEGAYYATNTITGNHTNGTKTVVIDIDVTDVGNPTSVFGTNDVSNPVTKIDLSWVKDATTDAGVMIVRSTDASFVTPTNGDSYSVGSTVLGGDTVVYTNAGTSFEDSSLSEGTPYYYRLYSRYYDYYSSGVTTNITTKMPQAKNSGGGGVPQEPATLYVGDTGEFACQSWGQLEGNSAKWRVVIHTNSDLSVGSAGAYTGSYVNQEPKTNTSATFTTAGTWYWGMQVDYETFGSNHWYKADNSDWADMAKDGTGASLSVTVTALSVPGSPGAVTNTARPYDAIDLSWTPPNGHNVMIVRGADDSWIAPTNGDNYAQGNTALGGDTVVYNGSGTAYTNTGLADATTHYYRFYTVNNDYYSGGVTASETTESAPPPVLSVGPVALSFAVGLGAPPSEQTFTVTNTGVATLVYTNAITYGADPGWLTLAPTNGSLAEGVTQVHTATVSKATQAGTFYATNTLTGNQDNGAQTVTVTYTVTNLPNPTALSASSIGTTSLTVNWTKHNDYNVMVVRRAGADPDVPTNGTPYAFDATYGPDGRNRIVYATDSGSSAGDMGLTANTVYHYGFFSENSSYYSSGTFLTTTTKVASIDGLIDEWTGAAPTVDNSSTIVNGEFIWKDKKYERRTDLGSASDLDMHEFRMRADGDDVYFMVKYDNITDVAIPYLAVGVDVDQDPSDSLMNWIADDSDTAMGDGYYTNGNARMHYPDYNIIVHTVPNVGQRIELHEDDEGSWKAPPTHGDQTSFFEKDTNEIIEFKVARADLGLSGAKTARLTVASYYNNTSIGDNQFANDGDTTADNTGTDAMDTLSLLPYGVNDMAGDYGTAGEETSDNDLDSFFDITFDANGIVANTLPTTPALTFPSEGATIESGPMSVMWSPSTDADDDVTSYFVEISTDASFGGGENQTVLYRGNTKHLDPMYPVSATLGVDTYYWRTRARDLDGALSGYVTNSFSVSGAADSDTTGPTPTLLYIGPTYTNGASQTNITDRDFANTNDFVDIAVVWSDDSGVFLTNSAAYSSTNIVSSWGRVIPNWDLVRTNTVTHATEDFGFDQPFDRFYGTNGATIVTTVYENAFSITNALLNELFFLSVSAEDADDDRGHYPDPTHNGDPIPWDRSITTNAPILIPITDDDSAAPVFSAVNVDGVELFSTRMNGDLVITGLLQDAGSGVYGGSSNRYVLYRNDAQVAAGALDTAPVADGEAMASAAPIGVTIAEATATVPGAYRLDVMATDYDIERPGDSISVTNTYDYTVITPAFDYRMKIYEPDYTDTAILTNFPVQVVFSTSLSGFSYSQFASPTGGDLRFCDENGDTWLDYAFENWDTGGSSTNWVKIPTLTSNTVIWAYWGNSTGTNPPPATTNGAVWSDWSEGDAAASNFTFSTYAAVVAPGTYFELDAAAAASGVTLPYVEDFEDINIGALSGQSHWVVQGTTRARNQTAKIYAGSRGASMEHAVASHGIEDATGTNVWVAWFAWPDPCATNPVDAATLSTNTTAVFYLNPDGHVVALSNNTWVTYNGPDLGTNNWIRFIVEMDYTAEDWDLYAVGATTNARIAAGLPFKNTNRSAFTSFRMVEGGVTPLSYLDNIGVAASKPLGVDTDADEMPDMWEESYMTNTDQLPTGDFDNDGINNLREYMAGTNPNNSNETMRLIGVDLVGGAASSDVQLKLLGGGAFGNTNFFSVGDDVQRTFKIYAANNSVTNTKTLVGSVEADGSGTNVWTDSGMTDAYTRRFYEISVEHVLGGYTNTEEWAVHVQPRAAGKSYLICAPVKYEGTNNNLNAALGDHLERGLHADASEANADKIRWIAEGGGWTTYWLSTSGWKVEGGGASADVEITPGQGMWVVRGSGDVLRSNAVFAGKSFMDADVQGFTFNTGDAGLSQDGWTMSGWPLPEPREVRASDATVDQLGFVSAGAAGGESPDPTNALSGDQIWLWNDGWNAYWLIDKQGTNHPVDGRWYKGHGTSGDDFADIVFEPGKGFYYFHSSIGGASDVTWTPTNAP